MKFNPLLSWVPVLLVLSGCPNPPPNPPVEEKRVLTTVSVDCPESVVAGSRVTCTARASDQKGDGYDNVTYTWTASTTTTMVDPAGHVTAAATGVGTTVTIHASATVDGVTQAGEDSLAITEQPATVHSDSISASETWTAANNPHAVSGHLEVLNGATLTLEPGVEVRFEPDAQLRLSSGSLKAEGSAAAPVRLVARGAATAGSWRGVVFATEGSGSVLKHVSLSHCGKAEGEGACLAMLGKAAPVLQDVEVRSSGSAGVKVADDGSAFGPGSARLKVSGSAGPAVRLGANQASTLPPDSSFAGNSRDVIELSGDVVRSQTWPNPGPGTSYVINDSLSVDALDDNSTTTLTLSAGTTLRFGVNGKLYAGEHYPGTLIVDGTEAQPVLFTADSDSPSPGFWKGVFIPYLPNDSASRISHAIIEFAGGATEESGQGNLNIYGVPHFGVAPVIYDVILRKSSGPGIYTESGGKFGEGSGRIQVRDNGDYAMRMSADGAGSIPMDTVISGNAINAVAVHDFVTSSQTWPNLGIPYVINGVVEVGGNPGVTLTLTEGTEIQFAKNAAMTVGFYTTAILIAKGTADKPIRFVADIPNAPYDYWGGINFWQAAGSQLDHVIVSHGGIENGNIEEGVYGPANVNVLREIGSFITNSQFIRGNICAISVSKGLRPGTTEGTTDFFAPANNNSYSGSPIQQCKY